MAATQSINEDQRDINALGLADRTGVSDIFAYENTEELSTPFPPIADPTDLMEGVPSMSSLDFTKVPKEYPSIGQAPAKKSPFNPVNWLNFSGVTRQPSTAGIYEELFGYNAEDNLPWGYEKMTDVERAVLRAHLNTQNFFTRMGLGAAKQVRGAMQLALPESMEQYLVSDKEIKEGRPQEDKYYEKRIQSELRKKKKDVGLSDDEDAQLTYLDETLPSNWQKLPEFTTAVVAEIEQFAIASEFFNMISVPGGGKFSKYISDKGKRLLGNTIMGTLATAKKAVGAKIAGATGATKAALDSLVHQIESLGPNAGALFTWGVIRRETGEADEALQERITGGAKAVPWALLPVLLAPTAKGLAATKSGQAFAGFMQRVVAKTAVPIADKLAKMEAKKAAKILVHQGMIEADDLSLKEIGRVMNAGERKLAKETLTEIVDEVSKIVKEPADDIIAKIESLAGSRVGSSPVGAESVIPKSLRSVETVGDDVVNGTIALVEKRTQYTAIRQPNGRYAILDKTNLHEVAVDIKRSNLSKELDDVIFGVGGKGPVKHRLDVTKRVTTPRVIAEEVELKRSLSRMQTATNTAFRAGAKEATEKAEIKLLAGRERLQTIRAGYQEQWKNMEFARELVKEFVPKENQHLFLNRITKSKTEGGIEKILDDIGSHIDRLSVNNSIDSIRSSIKSAKSLYRDKTGPFAKAPDTIRPILEKLDKSVAGITKLSQEATSDISGFRSLADDMIDGLNSALVGKGEVLGIPVGLADDLYSLSTKTGEKVTAEQIRTLTDLTNLVIHRAKSAHMIDIGGELAAVGNTIDNSLSRIAPRPVTPRAKTLPASLKRLYGVDSDHPITLVEKMFGTNSHMATLLDDLYEGETKAFGVMRNSYGMVKDYLRRNNIDDDIFSSMKKKVSVQIDGKTVKLSRDDVLGLAMSTRDPWVFNNLLKTEGYTIGGIDIARASVDELGQMFSILTPQEMKLGGVLFDLNNNYLSQVINGTSLHLNGIKIATYPQYYPSHRALNKTLYGNKWPAFRTAETQSNFMPRMGGTGRMKINPFSRELMDYIQNSSMYHGTSSPMRSLKTVLADKTLQASLKNGGYSDEMSNFIDILSRGEGLYSDGSILDNIGSQAINRFTKSVLGGRVSTIMTQIGSVPAAKEIIPSKFFRATDMVSMKDSVDDLMSSDFFWYRWTGRRVSVELGDTASASSLEHFILGTTPLSEKPLSGLVWGDKKAIAGSIYPAAKRYIAETTKLTGDDITRAAIKLTEQTTRKTQPNWSVLTRSKLASDPSVFKRSLTMFRTAQEAQFNIWKRANVRFARSGRTANDISELSNSYRAVIEAQLAVAISKTAWKRGRQAGVAGVAGWMGVHAPQTGDSLPEDLVKSTARTMAGTVPLGQLLESATEAAFNQLYHDRLSFNTEVDPISTIAATAASAVTSVLSATKARIEANAKREGFTSDLLPTSLDDMLDSITTSDTDRKQIEQEIHDKTVSAIIKSARAVGLVIGAPVGPIDEFVAPAFRRSKFALVRRVNTDNATDPISIQRNLDKFLTLQAELKKKEDKSGLTKEEAATAFDMNIFKRTYIDVAFGIDDVAGEKGGTTLDLMEKPLSDFIKRVDSRKQK